MEIVKVIEEAHEGEIVSLAYNKARKEIFSSAEGEKVIKASSSNLVHACMHDNNHSCLKLFLGLGLEDRPACPCSAGSQGDGDKPVFFIKRPASVLWVH